MNEPPTPEPPDDFYVNQRRVKPERAKWAKDCNQIMLAHGIVQGSETYSTKDRARYWVRELKRLMVAGQMHDAYQLREHVDRAHGGWIWSLEYLGRNPR